MGFDPNESWTPVIDPGPAPSPSPPPAPNVELRSALAPGPRPGEWGGAPQQVRTTAGGKPVDQYGNIMTSGAGQAKSAQMQAAAQAQVATKAYEVAKSEASLGRVDSAQAALAKAEQAASTYIASQTQIKRNIENSGQTANWSNLAKFQAEAKTTGQTIQGMIDKLNTPVNTPVIPDNKPPDNKPSTLPPSPFNPIISRSPESIPPPSPTLIPAKDVVNFQTQPASIEAMEQILFEQIGGYELINLVRRDTVEGQNPFYTLISNLSSVRRDLDPSQIISLQKANQTGFERYEISLEQRIPGEKYLTNNNISNFFYIASNGDLVIELDNVKDDEEIEVQMASSGKIT